jgi:hypothetical protein
MIENQSEILTELILCRSAFMNRRLTHFLGNVPLDIIIIHVIFLKRTLKLPNVLE